MEKRELEWKREGGKGGGEERENSGKGGGEKRGGGKGGEREGEK